MVQCSPYNLPIFIPSVALLGFLPDLRQEPKKTTLANYRLFWANVFTLNPRDVDTEIPRSMVGRKGMRLL